MLDSSGFVELELNMTEKKVRMHEYPNAIYEGKIYINMVSFSGQYIPWRNCTSMPRSS